MEWMNLRNGINVSVKKSYNTRVPETSKKIVILIIYLHIYIRKGCVTEVAPRLGVLSLFLLTLGKGAELFSGQWTFWKKEI